MIRAATAADVRAIARLHASEISEGFLASLGPAFLARLYRRVVRHDGSLLLVAGDGGAVSGFAAATEDTGALYRSFLVRDGLVAAVVAGPRLLLAGRRVLETLRYPRQAGAGGQAELLAVAVAPDARGRGLGRALVEAATAQLRQRGSGTVRVVTASHNRGALALYGACGFRPAARLSVHRGTTSEVLQWS